MAARAPEVLASGRVAHLVGAGGRALAAGVLASLLFTLTSNASEPLKEPVFTAPADYVASAPDRMRPCPKGIPSLITSAEFRRFGLRNEVWPQEDGVDLSRESWSGGRVAHVPAVDFGFAGKARRGFKAQVWVLVDGNGQVLDKVVTCSTAPAYNEPLLALIDGFRFEPSRYKGRGLNTTMPVDFRN